MCITCWASTVTSNPWFLLVETKWLQSHLSKQHVSVASGMQWRVTFNSPPRSRPCRELGSAPLTSLPSQEQDTIAFHFSSYSGMMGKIVYTVSSLREEETKKNWCQLWGTMVANTLFMDSFNSDILYADAPHIVSIEQCL